MTTTIENGELGSSARAKINQLLALAVNAQTGGTYQVQITDQGKLLTFDNPGGTSVIVPSGLGQNFYCMMMQKGSGVVTISGSGTTINCYSPLHQIAGQFGVASVYAYESDIFVLSGMVV